MGKKVLFSIICFFLVLISRFYFTPLIFAQESSGSSGVAVPDIFPIPNPEPGFLGQDHSYSVTFRGNGEAVVALKVVLTNKGESPLSEATLRIPKVAPQEIFVYQVLRDPVCSRFLNDNTCLETQEPDYYGYYWSKSRYQKSQSEYSGDTLKVILPQAIASNKSGSFFVYFRAMGYAEKNMFGAYQFSFESFQVDDDIRNLTVGISTDSDLVLRGATGDVNYRFEDASPSLKAVGGGGAPAESSAIDTFYNQIGYGSLVKTASSLAPLESYTVSSSYASTRIKLYAKEAAWGVGIFLGLMVLAVVVSRILLRKSNSGQGGTKVTSFDSRSLILSLGVSFGSAALVSGYSVLAILAVGFLTRNIGYDFQAAATILVVVISFAVYALFLFAPGIYLGAKKGMGWGIATLFLTVFWMLIFLGVGLLIYLSVRTPNSYPGPIPLGGASLGKPMDYDF